ncbi:MAG: hypothetical protein U0610_11670 [bacterium]
MTATGVRARGGVGGRERPPLDWPRLLGNLALLLLFAAYVLAA